MGIPLDEAIVALDTDYASEAYTCSSDDETSPEPGEDQDDGHGRWKATRREKAGLGATAKMVLGPMWRNADVSTSQETNTQIRLTILTLSFQYTAFARWLTFKYYKGKASGKGSELTSEPLRKRRRTTMQIAKGFKKEFDPPPLKLSSRLPSTKVTPFKAMIADWWLRDHPDFETLDCSGEWLKGFRNHLEKDDLHPLDWDHLDELEGWHEEKGMDGQHDSEFLVGSLAQVI